MMSQNSIVSKIRMLYHILYAYIYFLKKLSLPTKQKYSEKDTFFIITYIKHVLNIFCIILYKNIST